MSNITWLLISTILLSGLCTYMWFVLCDVSSSISEYKTKIDKRLDYTDEKCGDYKLEIEKGFIHARDKICVLDQSIDIIRTRLDKLEGVKAPGKKTKKTKRKKS